MQTYKLFILTKLKKFLDNKEKVIIFLFLFLVFISHSIISLFHFHECDSSDVYKYLTDTSIFSRGHFIEAAVAGCAKKAKQSDGIVACSVPRSQPERSARSDKQN